MRAHQHRVLPLRRAARVSETRILPGELAVVQLRRHGDGPLRILGDLHPVVHDIGGAGRNQTDIQQAARLPRVALVDRIAVAVEHQRTVEVRARIHRSLSVIGHAPAPEHSASRCVLALQFKPDIERIHRAAGEEMTDLPRADHHVELHRIAGTERCARLIQRRGHLADLAQEHRPGRVRLLADGKRRHRLLRAVAGAADHLQSAALVRRRCREYIDVMKPDFRKPSAAFNCVSSPLT
jgi:hypothetical protein